MLPPGVLTALSNLVGACVYYCFRLLARLLYVQHCAVRRPSTLPCRALPQKDVAHFWLVIGSACTAAGLCFPWAYCGVVGWVSVLLHQRLRFTGLEHQHLGGLRYVHKAWWATQSVSLCN
jgi:hypothetical protein